MPLYIHYNPHYDETRPHFCDISRDTLIYHTLTVIFDGIGNAMISLTTLPATSVSRKFRPA